MLSRKYLPVFLPGIGLMTWSPVSFGLCPGDKTEDAAQFFIKLANKVKLKAISPAFWLQH